MKLRDLAYYRTGGRCQALYEPRTVDELSRIITALQGTKQPYFVLGGGTNSLVLDDDWPGAVIVFTRMKRIEISSSMILCDAGADNSDVVKKAWDHSLSGLSWMYRLPGQIGGTVRMNARCYGGEISQLVKQVTAVMPNGEIRIFTPQDGIFRGYKDTVFMENGAVIASVALSLSTGDPNEIESQMNYCESDRNAKGQFQYPTCGCVFKNDYSVGVPSGMLLDKAGVRTLNTERVAINPKHANFVYNKGASSREILEFTIKMRELVYEEFGVWLEYEMEILGLIPTYFQEKIQAKRPPAWKEDKLAELRSAFQKKSQK